MNSVLLLPEGSLLKSLWRTWIKTANIFLTASEHSTSSKREPLGQINPALPFSGRLSQGRKSCKWIQILQNLRSSSLLKFWVMVTIARASLDHCSRTLRKDNLKTNSQYPVCVTSILSFNRESIYASSLPVQC